MKMATGSFKGHTTAVFIACGFLPDYVKIVNVNGTGIQVLEWNRGCLDGPEEIEGGVLRVAAQATDDLRQNAAAGVSRYSGGETIGAGNTDKLIYKPDSDVSFTAAGEGVVLPDGFKIGNAAVNVNGETMYFEAGLFDN